MKRIFSIIALVLICSMLLPIFSSCGNLVLSEAALAAVSDRILEGVEKLSSSKTLCASMDIVLALSFPGFPLVSMEAPIHVDAQYNVADESDPRAYFAATILGENMEPFFDAIGEKMGSLDLNVSLYYADGTLYFAQLSDHGIKAKFNVDTPDLSVLSSVNMQGIPQIVIFDEGMVRSASFVGDEQGEITAKVTVDSQKAMKSFLTILTSLMGSDVSSQDVATFETLLNSFFENNMIGDTDVSLTLDAENNVIGYEMSVGMEMKLFELMGISEAEVFGDLVKTDLSVKIKFDPVEEDFTVFAPEDLALYTEEISGFDDIDDNFSSADRENLKTNFSKYVSVEEKGDLLWITFADPDTGKVMQFQASNSQRDLLFHEDGTPSEYLIAFIESFMTESTEWKVVG